MREVVVGYDAPRYLWLLMATVLFVLLVASANSYLSSILLLLAVTALAAWLPAWRASGIDPIRALRAA